jgi:protocatechuate 3,4-dioxygenase beta subunit
MHMRRLLLIVLALFGTGLLSGWAPAAADGRCVPTAPDSLGPFYKPDAPLRSAVGRGYVLSGKVLSAADCVPIPGAAIELWLANPEGVYDDAHRAKVVSDASGAYRFESDLPPDYGYRPPHIHLRITAQGFKPLVTQHYPEEGRTMAGLDLVLIPNQ